MSKKINSLKAIGNENPFKVPEGYFDGLTDRIMSQLPERISEPFQPISFWERAQPYLYIAAMFCGATLMINLLTRSPQRATASDFNLLSLADMEDFYQYYEEQVTNSMYNDAIFIDVE